jgi:Heparinase II/III-like protein
LATPRRSQEACLTLDTLKSERHAFVTRLRGDPIFLLQHVPALWSALHRRLRTKITIALASPHQGRKRWPDWIGERTSPTLLSCDRPALVAQFPTYPGRASLRAGGPSGESNPEQTTADAEDQFARHRWGFLSTALLDEVVEWQRALEQCKDWIGTNTDMTQPGWEPYSAGERIANLLVFIASMPPDQRPRELTPPLTQFLDRSIDWIYAHLEYYGQLETNNHILGNARALVIGGVARNNAAAIEAGMRIFHKWLPELLMSGGFLRERSSHYQLVVLNWLLDAWHFLAAHAGHASVDAEFLRGHAKRMLAAAGMVCDSNGRLLALIGDVSPDATPSLSAARLALLYPDSWPAAVPSPAVEVRDGWFRISTGEDVVVGNLPPGRYPSRFPTHGHNDCTGFIWRHGATEILIDPGRYRYTPDVVSLSQASAAGHNLPIVNGLAPVCESLLVGGQWWPRPYADAVLQVLELEAAVVLIHDGFARATPVTCHRRRIEASNGQLAVQDSFDGHGTIEVAWCWHFGPGIDRFDAAALVAGGEAGQVCLRVEGLRGSPRVTPISGPTPGGWISDRYGRKQTGVAVCLSWNVELPAVVSTHFRMLPRGESCQ